MTPQEFEEAMIAINQITMNTILPGGVWLIALLGLSQVAAAGVLIWLLSTL